MPTTSRRSLLCRVSDGTGHLTLRFFHFSGAQQQNLERVNLADSVGDVLSVGGAATLAGGAGAITIGAPGTVNFGTLTFNTTGAVNITEDSDMLVTGINTAGALTLTTSDDMDSTVGMSITALSANLMAGGVIGGYGTGDVPAAFKETVPNVLLGVKYDPFGMLNVPTGAITVRAGGYDSNSVSVDIVGTSISGLLTLTPPNVPIGAVLFNGLSQTSPPFIKGLSPLAGVAAVVAAHATQLTGNGGMLPPAPLSTADVFMATAFPTENVREQITAGAGTVGLLSPLIRLQGIGINVSAELASVFQRQEDEMKKRRATKQ